MVTKPGFGFGSATTPQFGFSGVVTGFGLFFGFSGLELDFIDRGSKGFEVQFW